MTVLGAGSWGAALAFLLSSNGHAVTLWDRDGELLSSLAKGASHPAFRETSFSRLSIRFAATLEEAVKEAECVFTVIPAQNYRALWEKLIPVLSGSTMLVNCSKGIDVSTKRCIHQLLTQVHPGFPMERYTVLSGPSFAAEVMKKIPTAVALAGSDGERTRLIQQWLCNEWFRVYTNDDVLGVELAGAVKNVIAIASGICSGIGYGVNTAAALIVRGNAEIQRLGKALGACPFTFQGLAGIGDLILTATSSQSRNYSLGRMIGGGSTLEEAKRTIRTVVEGVETVKSARALAEANGVEMPIVRKVSQVLFEGLSPRNAVNALMLREPKSE
jgi:glycerol-3-phosphate dehydrogenase (NAD(P)+)